MKVIRALFVLLLFASLAKQDFKDDSVVEDSHTQESLFTNESDTTAQPLSNQSFSDELSNQNLSDPSPTFEILSNESAGHVYCAQAGTYGCSKKLECCNNFTCQCHRNGKKNEGLVCVCSGASVNLAGCLLLASTTIVYISINQF